MVKRIKKRVAKENTPDEELELEQPEIPEVPEAPEGTAEQLQAAFEEVADDDFTRKTAHLFQWLISKRLALGGLVVIAGVAVAAMFYTNGQKREAAEAASTALAEASETYIDSLPDAPTPGGFAADDSAARKKKLAAARAAFKAAAEAHPDSKILGFAQIGAAGAAFDEGDLDAAMAGFDKALATDLDSIARVVALQGKAAALESKGDKKAALAEWKTVEKVGPIFGLQARLQQGRLLESLGQKKAARTLYEATQKDFAKQLESFGNIRMKGQLQQRLSTLEAS